MSHNPSLDQSQSPCNIFNYRNQLLFLIFRHYLGLVYTVNPFIPGGVLHNTEMTCTGDDLHWRCLTQCVQQLIL